MVLSGKHVRIFLVDGTFGGLMTAEIMNWTGHVLKGKRSQLADICKRPEAQRPGVYLLVGEHISGGPVAYIGMADVISSRLNNSGHRLKTSDHDWSDVALVTSKDNNLTSAHVRYLEARLVEMARSVGRVPLDNTVQPSGGAELPEADASDMEYFLEQLQVLLPVVGIDLLRGRDRSHAGPNTKQVQMWSSSDASLASPVFELANRKADVHARAQVVDGEFTVLEGSRVAGRMRDPRQQNDQTARQYSGRERVHQKLLDEGAIVVNADGIGQLTRDVIFSSPSAAAAIVQGLASSNGRTAWKVPGGLTYGEWEDRDADDIGGAGGPMQNITE